MEVSRLQRLVRLGPVATREHFRRGQFCVFSLNRTQMYPSVPWQPQSDLFAERLTKILENKGKHGRKSGEPSQVLRPWTLMISLDALE